MRSIEGAGGEIELGARLRYRLVEPVQLLLERDLLALQLVLGALDPHPGPPHLLALLGDLLGPAAGEQELELGIGLALLGLLLRDAAGQVGNVETGEQFARLDAVALVEADLLKEPRDRRRTSMRIAGRALNVPVTESFIGMSHRAVGTPASTSSQAARRNQRVVSIFMISPSDRPVIKPGMTIQASSSTGTRAASPM